jgi:hypothetical protein
MYEKRINEQGTWIHRIKDGAIVSNDPTDPGHVEFMKWCETNELPTRNLSRTCSWQERRAKAYQQAWSLDDFQEAVMESAAGRPEKMDDLIARRAAVKLAIPKE